MTINTRTVDEITLAELEGRGVPTEGASRYTDNEGRDAWQARSVDGKVCAYFAPAVDVEAGDDESGDLGWDLSVEDGEDRRFVDNFDDVDDLLSSVADLLGVPARQ